MLSIHRGNQEPQLLERRLSVSTERSPKPSSPQGLALAYSRGSSTPDPSQDGTPLAKTSAKPFNPWWETTRDPGNTNHPKGILNNVAPTVGQQGKRNIIITTEVTLTDDGHHYDKSRPQMEDVTVDDHLVQQGDSPKKDFNEDDLTLAEPSVPSSVNDVLLLCDHPPNKFSPQFRGHPPESCAEYLDYTLVALTTMSLCLDIYRNIYGGEVIYQWLHHKNEKIRIIFDENFNALCLPLFRRFNHCEERKFLTICRDEEVLFFHSHSCRQPSQDDKFFTNLLIISLMLEEEECFHLVCSGILRIIELAVSGVTLRLVNLEYRYGDGKSCQHLFDPFSELLQHNKSIQLFANIHFPCCYVNYFVLWVGDPEEHGLNRSWDFLPLSCQVSELLLLVVASCVGLFGTTGNMIVLVVMLSGGHQRTESSTLRTSLALADCFIILFVVIPSVTDQLSLIVLGELISDKSSWKYTPEPPDNVEYYSELVVEGGYRLFQALVLGSCSLVSLFSLFLLSIERLILTGRGLAYKEYCSTPRVMVLVILTWIVALSDTLIFTYDENGMLSPMWSNMNMFTVGISRLKSGGLLSGVYYFRLVFLALTCTSTFIFSMLATVNFVQEQSRVAEEWRSLNMRVLGPIHEENRHITTSLILMTILFPLSVVPVGVCILLQEIAYFFDRWELLSYVSWWMFLAASAWNPWVYNIRSNKFRKDMKATFCKMVPRRVREKLHLQQKKKSWTIEATEKQMKMLRTLGLTSDSGQFNEHQQ